MGLVFSTLLYSSLPYSSSSSLSLTHSPSLRSFFSPYPGAEQYVGSYVDISGNGVLTPNIVNLLVAGEVNELLEFVRLPFCVATTPRVHRWWHGLPEPDDGGPNDDDNDDDDNKGNDAAGGGGGSRDDGRRGAG